MVWNIDEDCLDLLLCGYELFRKGYVGEEELLKEKIIS